MKLTFFLVRLQLLSTLYVPTASESYLDWEMPAKVSTTA